jgi:hypothetical protein
MYAVFLRWITLLLIFKLSGRSMYDLNWSIGRSKPNVETIIARILSVKLEKCEAKYFGSWKRITAIIIAPISNVIRKPLLESPARIITTVDATP